MNNIDNLQNALRKNHNCIGSISEWWDTGTPELKALIGNISIKLGLITPNTPWSDDRKYNDMSRTAQRKAIDQCRSLLNHDWTVVTA